MIYVITPFSRPHNVPALVEMLSKAGGQVTWMPVIHSLDICAVLNTARDDLAKVGVDFWGAYLRPPGPAPGEPGCETDWCYWKCNAALRWVAESPRAGVSDLDYVGFLCDDDTYDAGLFDSIPWGAPVHVVSARRYGGAPEIGGGVLRACRENMRPCQVGLEQVFVRMDLMRMEAGGGMPTYRFGNHGCADGELWERIGRECGCMYHPELFVNWNILPPRP